MNSKLTQNFHIKGGETHFKLWFPCNPSWSQNFSLWLILLPRLSTGISLQGITQATARYSVVAIFCFKFYSTLEESSLFSLLLGFGPRKYLHNLTRCALLHSSTQSGIEIHSKLNKFLQIDGISNKLIEFLETGLCHCYFFLELFSRTLASYLMGDFSDVNVPNNIPTTFYLPNVVVVGK